MTSGNVRTRVSAGLVLLALVASAGAAGSYKAPRTSWGDPQIQGFFTNNTDVPFERAKDVGDRAFFTQAEVDARRKPRPSAERTDVHYDTEVFSLNPEQSEMVQNLRTSIITQPANGRLPPLRADAQKRSDAVRTAQAGNNYDSAQDRPLGERCVIWPHEGPPLRPVGYNTHVQIMQTKDHVIFESEMIHDARVIPISKTRPDFGGLTRWQGNSWGHWEGETLVIETTGIDARMTPRGSNLPLGPQGKVVEKITRVDAKTIRYEFTVSDPALWDVAWGGEFPMELTEGPMFEYACHEGNYGIATTLRGAREEEAAKAGQKR